MKPVGKPDKKKADMTAEERGDYREWIRYVRGNSRL